MDLMILPASIVVWNVTSRPPREDMFTWRITRQEKRTVLSKEQRDKLINFKGKSIFLIMKKSLHIYSTCGK